MLLLAIVSCIIINSIMKSMKEFRNVKVVNILA